MDECVHQGFRDGSLGIARPVVSCVWRLSPGEAVMPLGERLPFAQELLPDKYFLEGTPLCSADGGS
jgi:hypothetical protein